MVIAAPIVILRQFDPNPVPVGLVHAGQGRLPAKSRCFIDFAAPRLRKALEKLTKRNPPGLAKVGSTTNAYA
ncbi:hypothetical protein [Variovorax sp. GT1P44]|uniref:hypothetical protein n=1 Tax=Variovorax sp. GT1P44 TaxID=3443742 RepID=UPI003F458D59